MSNHKDSLVKVLEYLVNEEREKASDLLHDIFVEKAKNHWSALSESDESVEDDIQEEDLDETYDAEDDIEEAVDAYDAEEDFLSDIESSEDEIDQEEVFGEGDDDMDMDADDAEMDLAMDMEDEGEEAEEGEAEEAMANVEDAIAELRAAFADLMGDDEAEEEAEDEAEEDTVEGLGEGAELSAVNATMANGEDSNAKSPVAGKNDMGGTAVDMAGGAAETGGKAPAPKDMGVDGPQEAGDPTPAPAPKREMK
jgi:hypothetical protein